MKDTIEVDRPLKNIDDARRSLESALDSFKERYGSRVEVIWPSSERRPPLELTDAFVYDGKYRGPRAFGNIGVDHKKVEGYVVKGMNHVVKYETDEEGKATIRDGKFVARPVDEDVIVEACLCLDHTRNTTLAEVYGPTRTRDNVQGFPRKTVDRIVKLVQLYIDFDPMNDTLYMFAGQSPDLLRPEGDPRTSLFLHKTSLELILEKGKDSLHEMTDSERYGMISALGKKVQDLKVESRLYHKMLKYAYQRESYGLIEESAVYLMEKVKQIGPWIFPS